MRAIQGWRIRLSAERLMARTTKRTAAASASQWARPASVPLGARGARKPVDNRAQRFLRLSRPAPTSRCPYTPHDLMRGTGPSNAAKPDECPRPTSLELGHLLVFRANDFGIDTPDRRKDA